MHKQQPLELSSIIWDGYIIHMRYSQVMVWKKLRKSSKQHMILGTIAMIFKHHIAIPINLFVPCHEWASSSPILSNKTFWTCLTNMLVSLSVDIIALAQILPSTHTEQYTCACHARPIYINLYKPCPHRPSLSPPQLKRPNWDSQGLILKVSTSKCNNYPSLIARKATVNTN